MAKTADVEKTETQTDSLDDFLANVDEDGTHLAVVESVSSSTSKKSGKNWLVFKYLVNDPASAVDGEDFDEFIEDFSHVTLSDYNTMTGADKRRVREEKRRLRERLLTLGVAENEVAGYNDWNALTGREVSVTVETSIGSNGRKYTNIRSVELVTEEL